jgi:tripartite-type tricarboxylate transporter receptor subunit TctC
LSLALFGFLLPRAMVARRKLPSSRSGSSSISGRQRQRRNRAHSPTLGKLEGAGAPPNQPGAAGNVGTEIAARAPADGYNILFTLSSHTINPKLYDKLPFDVERDFVSISFVLQQPLFIGVSHKSGITSLSQLIALAKEKPGAISYAATGRGRLTHLTMELLQARAGINLQLVPYAGGPAQAMNDVVSGRVELVLDAYAGLAGALKGDLIRGLAATSLERLPGFETLATVAETLPDFFVGAWNVMLAPNGTPDAIVRKVNADLRVALDDPEVAAKLAANGAFARYMTPAEVTAFVQAEQRTWRPILQRVAAEAK